MPTTLGYEASAVVTAVGADVDSGWLNKTVSTVQAFSMNQYGALGSEVIYWREMGRILSQSPYRNKDRLLEAIHDGLRKALVKFGQVKKGEFILITAASSATGLAAIQSPVLSDTETAFTTAAAASRADRATYGSWRCTAPSCLPG